MKSLMLVFATGIVAAGFWIAQGAGGTFTDGFAGSPAAPLPFSQLGNATAWDVQVHSRDSGTWNSLEPMQAQHGPDCAGPPATHTTSSYEGAVFQCRDHVMTALNASGYGVIYLTPNQLVDISSGGTVSFEISSERMSTRDWWDIWITPYADNVALPFNLGEVDLAGAPRNAVQITIDNAEGAPVLITHTNGASRQFNDSFGTAPTTRGITAGTNEAAVRQTMRLTISPTRVKFERVASATATAIVFFDRAIPALSWRQGVVQFGHHSYNPTKDGSGDPATWHWDNVTISPAEPFTIIKADRRYADSASQRVTFAQPAPANAMLRFAAIGRIEVSFDGGPFTLAQRQFATENGAHPEHFSSYWTPMPAGARAVNFRFSNDDWYTTGYPMMAKDFAIFSSTAAASPPPPAPASTVTPTATPTPTAAATATPTPTPATTPPAPGTATLSGSVSLQGRTNYSGVTVTLSPGGRSAVTNGSGAFSVTGLTPGQTYRVEAAAPGFLSAVRAAFVPANGANTLPAVTLLAGDAVVDGSVSIIDVSVVSSDYGGPPTRGFTDFTGNGTVDIVDVSIVSTNYGRTGPIAW